MRALNTRKLSLLPCKNFLIPGVFFPRTWSTGSSVLIVLETLPDLTTQTRVRPRH